MGTPLQRLIAGVGALGIGLQAGVGLLTAGNGPISRVTLPGPWHAWAHGPLLLGVLLALTFAGDLVAVRVRHGEETEELTLFEAAVVVDVLLLPSVPALLVPVAASLLCSLARRRGLTKTLFNAANLAAATAVLVGIVAVISEPGQGLSLRTVGALVVGTLAFTMVNLVALSRVLALVTGGTDPWEVVRHGARLSCVMAVGTVALGGTMVTLASAAPALVPFTIMPAAALTFAYRAAAQESEERERSSRLLALSELLAGRPDPDELLSAFLDLSRAAFGADVAVALLDSGEVVTQDGERRAIRRTPTRAEAQLLAGPRGPAVLHRGLPTDWVRAVLAPLEAEGRRIGIVLLAVRDRHRPLGDRELALLTPLGSALAVALRAAEHLQRITEETSKLQAVVDSSSDGILVLDEHGAVSLWSPALAALTGVPADHALGGRCEDFEPGRTALTQERPQTVVELTLVRPDGEERVVRCAHAGVFHHARLVRDVVMVHDVTRERQVERMKADFIATVSHELRTPVTPIKGYADLLRRRGDQMTPEKRNQCLDVIVDRAGHLARLVEDLLLASRISAAAGTPAQVEIRPEDLAALTLRACADFGADTPRLRPALPEGPVIVACDRVRVVQVLTNLIGNALKYSDPSTPVVVTLRVDADQAHVEIEDRGKGIPADQIDRIFDKFHRVEDPMRMTTGGTGLGLYIARQLTTAMGGTLTCSSTLGVGSNFSLNMSLLSVSGPGSGGVRRVPDPRSASLERENGPSPLG